MYEDSAELTDEQISRFLEIMNAGEEVEGGSEAHRVMTAASERAMRIASRMNAAFDALCHQSTSFHTNRFGGTLVSQTTKYMNAYNQLIEVVTWPILPISVAIVAICVLLGPTVPLFTVILMAMLVVYALVSYRMYRRILNLNEEGVGHAHDRRLGRGS